MSLEITGKVIDILEEKSGEGRNGTWRKQEFILETPGQYPKPVCIVQWGDNIDKFGIRQGETVTAHIDIQSREFNGKWYTDVKAWRVERPQADGGGGDGPPPISDEPWPEPAGDEDDELPF
ncbi:MAG: DUF3127 domain-containing protein [Gemmatimonadota bacterium]